MEIAIEPQDKKRRFRVLDALVLTAAIAVALAATSMLTSVAPLPGPANSVARAFRYSLVFQLCLITITWTLASLVLFDKFTLQRSVMAPGNLSLVTILGASVFAMAVNWGDLVTDHLPLWFRIAFLPFSILSFPAVPGFIAISGWLTCRLARVERPCSDWLEISGNIVAWVWIAHAFTTPLSSVLVLRAIGVTM
jgi:hypothetical protein